MIYGFLRDQTTTADLSFDKERSRNASNITTTINDSIPAYVAIKLFQNKHIPMTPHRSLNDYTPGKIRF